MRVIYGHSKQIHINSKHNHYYVTQQKRREIECVNSPVFLCLMSLEALALAQSWSHPGPIIFFNPAECS